jgi:hypothetical protein
MRAFSFKLANNASSHVIRQLNDFVDLAHEAKLARFHVPLAVPRGLQLHSTEVHPVDVLMHPLNDLLIQKVFCECEIFSEPKEIKRKGYERPSGWTLVSQAKGIWIWCDIFCAKGKREGNQRLWFEGVAHSTISGFMAGKNSPVRISCPYPSISGSLEQERLPAIRAKRGSVRHVKGF